MAEESGKTWGYVLVGDGRPDPKMQRRVMGLLGVDMSEFGTCWSDKLPPRATRPRSALIEREALVSALGLAPGSGDRVAVASLLCLGVSAEDARWFVEAVLAAGATVVVHDGARIIEAGADLAPVLDDYERARKAMYVRRSRAKAKKSKKAD